MLTSTNEHESPKSPTGPSQAYRPEGVATNRRHEVAQGRVRCAPLHAVQGHPGRILQLERGVANERFVQQGQSALLAEVTGGAGMNGTTELGERSRMEGSTVPCFKRHWPDPTVEMLNSAEFEAVWQCIKNWDINVPDAYSGYCGATGNHVRSILDSLNRHASDGWQPIESAPKDGTNILVSDGTLVTVARNVDIFWSIFGLEMKQNITHWMALPEPPK